MLFHSGSFLLLFTALIVAFAFRARALYLLLVSLFYCYACNEALVATLIFTTVVDYWIARVLHRNRSTALLVLDVEAGLAVVAAQPNCEGLLIEGTGERHSTPGWAAAVRFEPLSNESQAH